MNRKNPGIAAVLSFVFPGMGQMYNEQIWQGLALMVMVGISLLLCAIGIGFILLPIFWVVGIFDALHQARRINSELSQANHEKD